MVDQNVTAAIISSLTSRFKAQRDEAMATIMIYMTNPAGIGDHSEIIEEIDKLFCKATEAEEKMKLLTEKFRVVSSEDGK